MPAVQHARGTRAALDALAAAGQLLPGQVYVLTDQARLAVALTDSTYQAFLKEGEGGSPSPLGILDYWAEAAFAQIDPSAGPFIGGAIASGTRVASGVADGPFGLYGVALRSHSTNSGSGYRYMTSSVAADTFGGGLARKFEAVFTYIEGYIRIGYFDQTGSGDVTDGAYVVFSTSGAENVFAQTVANTVTEFSADLAPLDPKTYHVQIDVAADASSARFRMADAVTGAGIFDVTHTTGIPNTTARAFGAGIAAIGSAGTRPLVTIHRMGIGTVAGYNRARR